MFTKEQLEHVVESTAFQSDYNWVQESLVLRQNRINILFKDELLERLDYFLEAVMASFPHWVSDDGSKICKVGAEIGEALSYNDELSSIFKKKYRLRASILYEAAGLPALSQAIVGNEDYNTLVQSLFKRSYGFRSLGYDENRITENVENGIDDVSNAFLSQSASNLLDFEQGETSKEENEKWAFDLAKFFNFGLNASDVQGFNSIISNRFALATVSNVSPDLFESLQEINFPAELWPTQSKALKAGFLDESYDSFGLASPTGTGKTFLTRLLITKAIKENIHSKVLYIVPSRALVYEVSSSLQSGLEELDISVVAVNPQLVSLDDEEESEYDLANVVVLTPEKADLLVRLGSEALKSITHVIVDEAHHIEADTRGVLLELYLWRIKKLLNGSARFLFLSAVAPNIADLTNWMGANPKSEIVEQRATRMRAGTYRIIKNELTKKNEGWIEYSDGIKLKIIAEKIENGSNRKTLVQLANSIFVGGPILVVAKGKKECEALAKEMLSYLQKTDFLRPLEKKDLESDFFNRLDSRLEREMYPGVLMRELLNSRIAYHHAGLPPRVRVALEDAIRAGLIDYVFATTTLAEGVNFPFSSVIVQSLALREPPQAGLQPRYRAITPRTFWNIAGRAGRPGYDKEGQVILFEPALGLEKINYVLDSYLNPNMKDINPVRSALSNSISELYENVKDGIITMSDLDQIELKEEIPGNIRGTINLLRVGLVHAKATDLLTLPEDILESTFAYSFLDSETKEFGKKILEKQNELLIGFFKSRLAPSERIVAEMGLSIDTLERLKTYVSNLQDWQIKNFKNLFYGGEINLDQVPYIIGPVAKNIAELEGNKLGGYLSELIVKWLSGIPIISIKSELKGSLRNERLENLIHVIYSRIQFLLPWGLFAVDSIVEEEARMRNIPYNNELKNLSYLADAGVPAFDAHRLVNLDFERVDATRLYRRYKRLGGLATGVDIISWISNVRTDYLTSIINGLDKRRIDHDFYSLIDKIRQAN